MNFDNALKLLLVAYGVLGFVTLATALILAALIVKILGRMK